MVNFLVLGFSKHAASTEKKTSPWICTLAWVIAICHKIRCFLWIKISHMSHCHQKSLPKDFFLSGFSFIMFHPWIVLQPSKIYNLLPKLLVPLEELYELRRTTTMNHGAWWDFQNLGTWYWRKDIRHQESVNITKHLVHPRHPNTSWQQGI